MSSIHAVVAAIFALMVFSNVSTDLVLIGGVVVLLTTGILNPGEALAGLANEGVVTVGVLFIIGAAVQETGGVDWIAKSLFGRPKSVVGAIVRLVFPTLSLSAFLNNTPVVVVFIPMAKTLRTMMSLMYHTDPLSLTAHYLRPSAAALQPSSCT